jgi:hypothetical protein
LTELTRNGKTLEDIMKDEEEGQETLKVPELEEEKKDLKDSDDELESEEEESEDDPDAVMGDPGQVEFAK